MKKILILGASGTLGTYLTDELMSLGKYEVISCGNRNVDRSSADKKDKSTYKVDITKRADFDHLPECIDTVIQIAGIMPARMMGYDPEIYFDINLMGTLNVLEFCRARGVSKFIYTQSHSDVAGHWNTGKKISPHASRSLNLKGDHAVYIISKNAAVDLSEHYFQEFGIKNVILRLPTIYSYRPIDYMFVNGKKVQMAYRHLIQRALKGEALEIWGDPEVTKDIVYVKDFTQMVIKAVESDMARGFYNVATGQGTTLREQILGIAQVFNPDGKRSEIIHRPEKPSQTSYLYDISNAEADLGYSPNYPYMEALLDMKMEMGAGRFGHFKDRSEIFRID